ncbi:hypothetical protein TcasGA2_TC003667 [Tribolium castaneum]|uniref:Uncharacterized protein n=1 Tax=Tribolium castaneum TaxID=7070 RepID=D6WDI6_TRICA|nr:hypothetical protein TcasGA2_TC003667 [Tribolium castaneum]
MKLTENAMKIFAEAKAHLKFARIKRFFRERRLGQLLFERIGDTMWIILATFGSDKHRAVMPRDIVDGNQWKDRTWSFHYH